MEKNNCFTCKFRRDVPGSAHSACGVFNDPKLDLGVVAELMQGRVIKIKAGDVDLIEFNPIGIKNGWCIWPVDFDPIWVTCKLPINTEQ